MAPAAAAHAAGPRPQTDGQATSPRQLLLPFPLLLFSADTVGRSRRQANSVNFVASRCRCKDQRDRECVRPRAWRSRKE